MLLYVLEGMCVRVIVFCFSIWVLLYAFSKSRIFTMLKMINCGIYFIFMTNTVVVDLLFVNKTVCLLVMLVYMVMQ